MAIYNVNNFQDYMSALKALDKAKECGYKVKIEKYYPVATDKQQEYLNFCIRYFSLRYGQSYYEALRHLQESVCPYIFNTGEVDHQHNPKYKPICFLNTAEISSVIRNFLDFASAQGIRIPDKDDDEALKFCERDLESGNGWI